MSKDTAASSTGTLEAAQADVDRIRAELAATVDALVAKADVAGRARESAAQLTVEGRHRIEAAGEQVHETYEAAREKLRSSASDRVTPQTIAIGVGSAALVAAAVLIGRRR
jgi:F0F1-type ATP synthase membrane subunit b/b'